MGGGPPKNPANFGGLTAEGSSAQEEPEDLISEVRLCALRGHLGVRSALQSEAFQDRPIVGWGSESGTQNGTWVLWNKDESKQLAQPPLDSFEPQVDALVPYDSGRVLALEMTK